MIIFILQKGGRNLDAETFAKNYFAEREQKRNYVHTPLYLNWFIDTLKQEGFVSDEDSFEFEVNSFQFKNRELLSYFFDEIYSIYGATIKLDNEAHFQTFYCNFEINGIPCYGEKVYGQGSVTTFYFNKTYT